ncbi:cobyrinic acid a,c-diamide synthase [Natronocella acetinitrilica]|uniref:Cobyrinic acid a,c-diamide synthase n=1 Tax=Natronocella acetinitrilica TaxID=414046 RepID=A0AAE3G147_9GAMM|nr:cobyrinate a,c-diamide synthase [Natronocella acetinitrilica]MCP1673253.1 cobyrinic acid a,c-diamide synthase [Natronocella acetinitrilica]
MSNHDSQRTYKGTAAAALISAPGSGQGKSMITAALARLHRNAGRRVRVFKFGPDYLDPMVLELASGAPVYQIHPWMTGEAECRWRLAQAAEDADLVLVEGSMGLFDGDPASADIAVMAGLPAIPVIDAWGMAQTFGAVALGLATYRDDLRVTEVIANRVGSARHGALLAESMPAGMHLLGAVPRSPALDIPDRHLGLVQAEEITDLDEKLDAAAAVLAEAGLDALPRQVSLEAAAPAPPSRLLAGMRIAVARDRAFAFIYRANMDLLQAMGAELQEFSPLRDSVLPEADAVWLPGGYPELHAEVFAGNTAMAAALRAHHRAGKPMLAECGGLMACMESLVDGDGGEHAMLGLLPGQAIMAGRLMGLGIQSLETRYGQLRGHTFHHSRLETSEPVVARTRRSRGDSEAEPVYCRYGLFASYYHLYFPSCPEAVAAIFKGEAVIEGEQAHA